MAKKKPNYKITLTILGKKWAKEGKTIEAALAKFPLDWQNIKGKGVLTVKKGRAKHEHLYNMFKLRRIFSNKIVRASEAKNLEFLMKDGPDTNIPKKL